RMDEFSLLEDQKHILDEIIGIIDAEKPEVVLICGDIYDKPNPPAEAEKLMDEFTFQLAERKLPTIIISGNHDSAQRIAFGARLMNKSGIHLSPVYNGKVEPIVLTDEYGEVRFYPLPFVKPIHIRRAFEDAEIASYTDAVRVAIDNMHVDPTARNVLITHQFVTGAERSESEAVSVGGTDNVDASVFDGFDYVALGHIHGPQSVERETIRYCGTPLKYSFSEKDHVKSVTVCELGAKGDVMVRTVPLTPIRDLRDVRGCFADIIASKPTDDFVRVILTDENDIPDAMNKLRRIFRNITQIRYDNARTRAESEIGEAEEIDTKTPIELFEELFEQQNGRKMDINQRELCERLFEEISEAAK
ncbi:MAG: exonuclease SbcCD subunit D, partial [Oscillospiraceae bacterium]|nr:exonuclease SbcCD subunit D [Oscillospiraceae bacterium]